jgi:PAS domain S-box-containing protein
VPPPAGDHPADFLAGGGEMGDRIRGRDWAGTPVGPPDGWPQSLRIAVRVMLTSRYAMWLGWGDDLTFLYNDAYARMTLGPKHPWALGRPAREVWAEIWADIGPRLDRVLRTGEATWDESLMLFLERNGYPEETYHTFSYSPLPDDAGRVGGMLCVVTEDTDRTIGERRLRALRELAAATATARTADDACRRAAASLAGNPRDLPFALLFLADAGGPRLAAAAGLPADAPAADPAGWPVAAAGPVTVLDVAARFGPVAAGPWPEPVQTAVVLPLAPGGPADRPAGFLVAGVSPRRPLDDGYRGFLALVAGQVAAAVADARAHEEAERRAEALAEIDRAKTAFFSNVSHEFRTPLTLLLGPLDDALGRADLPADVRDGLAVARRNAGRLQKLVNTLLDFSRIEAGRADARYRPTDLSALTADLASTFRSACEKAGLRLDVDCPPLPEPVYVDHDMWEKVVLNLVSNAFKYTPAGGIRVAVREGNGEAVLTVADTGTGIPAAELPKLFNRFHRVAGARGRTHEGTGIGLALVQELVRLHGGTVRAESVEGRGSTFTVRLPLGTAHLPADRVASATETAADERAADEVAAAFVQEAERTLPDFALPVEAADDGRPRVLLADDNADMREYVRRLLAGRYAVTAVADGRQALAAAAERVPDLVLTDVMMPHLDGFALLAALRADPRTAAVPVVLVSARAGEEARAEGLRAGADDYLVKPFAARELVARVDGAVALARARREAARRERTLRAEAEALLEGMTDGFVAVDAGWRFTYVNARAEAIYRRPRAELLGRTLWDAFPEVAGSAFEPVFRRAMADRRPAVVEAPYDPLGGWFEVNVDPAPGGGLAFYFRNVSERRAADVALREAADRLSLAQTAGRVGVFDWDMAAGRVVWSPELEDLYGIPRGSFEGTFAGWADRVEPADAARVVLYLRRRTADRREDAEYEFRAVRPDGSVRWMAGIARLVYAADGRPVRMIGVNADVHERKLAEDALRAGEERFRLAAAAVNGLIYDYDVPAGTVWRSAGLLPLVGFTPDEADPTPDWWTARAHPEDLAAGRDRVSTVYGGREPLFDSEYRVRHRDGHYVHVWERGAVVRGADGRPLRVVGCTVDVTDRKAAADALREADRRKDEFIATLAHELRNPLAPMRNAVYLLRAAPAAADRVVDIMDRQVAHMVRLVDDLLEVSRITRGKVDLKREPVDLATAVRAAVDTARPLIDTAGHRLTVELPAEPVTADADPVRLVQVVTNLLNNAAKYTPAGGAVTVVAGREADRAVVRVRDTGVGIPADMLARVFDLFTQVDRTRRQAQGGLGIGLALVKSLVELHGGAVEAHSDGLGKGSEFVVRLPLAAGPAAATDPTAHARPLADRRVLIVDDNRDAAESLADLLRHLGGRVEVAHDGPAALAAAGRFRPAVVLLDIGMPGTDGYEVARRLRADPDQRGLVIVALTGWAQDEDRRRSRAAGFDHHLAKPVAADTLRAVLATVAG